VIDRRRSSVNFSQHLATIDVPSRIVLSYEVPEKLQRELRLCLEIFEFRICLINILQLQGALSPRTEALDPLEARPRTLCTGV